MSSWLAFADKHPEGMFWFGLAVLIAACSIVAEIAGVIRGRK